MVQEKGYLGIDSRWSNPASPKTNFVYLVTFPGYNKLKNDYEEIMGDLGLADPKLQVGFPCIYIPILFPSVSISLHMLLLGFCMYRVMGGVLTSRSVIVLLSDYTVLVTAAEDGGSVHDCFFKDRFGGGLPQN